MNLIGNYTQKADPISRISTEDVCVLGLKKHAIQALIEIDVTEARRMIRENKKKGMKISFTAWIIKCISCVCEEYKLIHGVKKGKHKVVVFDDVDISILVEREVQGEKVPLPYIIRRTNEKSISDIFHEIKQVQRQSVENEGDYVLGGGMNKFFMKAYYSLPGFVRRLFIKRLMHSPILTKKNMGTVVVTSLGMMGRFNGWFVPISIHPLTFAIGSIIKKPGIIHDTVAIREFLFITVLVDHDVIDGAPSARALARLIDLLEKGYGL
jgi:pyruvate/2-oxoglutarate dehydrogenase complex dihydrolipoamide acyltransferase (E2) component